MPVFENVRVGVVVLSEPSPHMDLSCDVHTLLYRMWLQYLRKIVPQLRHNLVGQCFKAGVTVLLSMAQYYGLEVVGMTSYIVVVVTLLPFAVLVGFGIPTFDWDTFMDQGPKGDEVDWALLFTNLFWNLNYCTCKGR